MLSLVTRQYASAFNQPLSLDTSSVTDMGSMFYVRSARALPSASTVGASLLLAPPTHPHPPSRLLARMSPLLLCFPLLLGTQQTYTKYNTWCYTTSMV